MKIQLTEIPIRDLVSGYKDSAEEGVVAYGGKLDIRPPYQREFVYREKQRNAVIETVRNGFPLNVMYWVKNGDGTFELLDGQQRSLSICQFIDNVFSIEDKVLGSARAFHNLRKDEQEKILDYKLMVYVCEGNDSEKLNWFRVINTAGEKLTDQELRNAIYVGPWVMDAKRYFSKTGCVAFKLGEKYVNGSPIRQDYLEKVLKWAVDRDGAYSVEDYMSRHQFDSTAAPLWDYFSRIIGWVKTYFTKYYKEMKGVEWGILFNKYGGNSYDPKELAIRIEELRGDDDVTNLKGIFEYVLGGDERLLSIRSFTVREATVAYQSQNGICPKCGKHFEQSQMQADHITPWSKGGHTVPENLQMLCADCNRRKSNI